MKPSEILRYYLNDAVIERLLHVKDRECAVRYGENFGKRPMYFQYKGDIENLIRTGATSFHISEERWQNPLELSKELTKEQLSSIRKGWDMVIDVDCKNVDISKIFTKMIKEKLEHEGVHSLSIKFSGGSGFHMLVPFEAFPESVNHIDTNRLFPDAPMIISLFLKSELFSTLRDTLRKDYGIKKLASIFGIDENKLLENGEFDPYKIIDIDTVLITERHMFRMQYSLNEKRWLVSIPIDKNRLEDFKLEDAKPENVDTKLDFFDLHPSKNEATNLFVRSYDMFEPEEKTEEEAAPVHYSELNLSVNPEYFPPCIKLINAGLSDGRKRSVFILTNFYRTIGRNKEEVLKLLLDWNKRNKPPLKENLITQQVEYAFSSKQYPPPNCDAHGYYKYFNVCFPDETCKLIKNPLSYYVRKSRKTLNNRNVHVSKRRQVE
ncbi:MAG: hypothetical protein M1433_01900 [Candidatus Parvarchaeota archaeon]|nr:hypothetical protein [Candidatus Parvarchaeota archaeon]